MGIRRGAGPRGKLLWRYWPEIVSLTIAASAVPLVAGWVPPNWLYGFRIPQTMSSPEEWYPANRLMGCYMLGSQVVAIVAMGRVSGAIQSRLGRDRVLWGVSWACVTALAGIGACVFHYVKFS